MSRQEAPSPDRRGFLKGAGVAAASLPVLIVSEGQAAPAGAEAMAPEARDAQTRGSSVAFVSGDWPGAVVPGGEPGTNGFGTSAAQPGRASAARRGRRHLWA